MTDAANKEMESNNLLNSLFPDICQGLAQELKTMFADEGELSDEMLLALHAVFGVLLDRALLLLDKKDAIVVLESPSGRKLVQVAGSTQSTYTIFYGVNFCSCIAFQQYVLGYNSEPTCKHVLAAWIGHIMGKYRVIPIQEQRIPVLMREVICKNKP